MKTIELFGRVLCVGDKPTLAACFSDSPGRGGRSMFFCNVHMLMLSQQDAGLASAMLSADFVFPDGVPIAWLQRRLGFTEADVFRGEEALEQVCERATAEGQSIGFYGASGEVLSELASNLQQRYPDLKIGYLQAPGKIANEPAFDNHVADQINAQNLSCLFIGLGCPKQEKWAALYASKLNCDLVCVGAVFDWYAGKTRKPPDWTVNAGLAWLYRLLQDPRRMWRRYLVYNSKFIIMTIKLMLSGGPNSKKKAGR